MTRTYWTRHAAGASLTIVLLGAPRLAVGKPQPTTEFASTHFAAPEGLPGGVVDRIDQSADGFLWLITNGTSLVRFDGKTFYRFDQQRLVTLAVAIGGDLWGGTREALIRIPSSQFTQFTLTGSTAYDPVPGKENMMLLRRGHNGVLWVGTSGGLFRYDGSQFVAVGPRAATREFEEAPDGHVLLVTPLGFMELNGSDVVPHPGLAARLGVDEHEILHVLKDRQGTYWYSTAVGLARERNEHIEKLYTYARGGHASARTYEDAQGTVWVGMDGEGLFRATLAGLESVAPGLHVRSLFSDRDGNLWVGTNGDGLYRFRRPAVRMFGTDDGLPGSAIMTTLVAHDGTLWTGANCGGISRFDGARFQTFAEKDGLLNSCVWALAEDANHDLWIGTWNGGAFRYRNGSFTQFTKKEGLCDDRVISIVAGHDGTIWLGTRRGVSRLKDGQFRTFKEADGLSIATVLRIFEDRSGVLWVGTPRGLHRLVGERFELFSLLPKRIVIPMSEDTDGGLFVANDAGDAIARIDKSRSAVVPAFPLDYDMLETRQGDTWLGNPLIRRIPPGQLAQARAHDEPLDYETLSAADGLPTGEAGACERTLALTSDGRLWAATIKGLAMVDLGRMPVDRTKPTIYITDLTIGRNTARAERQIVLPAGTTHLQIDFGTVELSSPEKVRLQYRLDGIDSEWLDAGPDPHAIYSTLRPGTRALRVRASNRSGIWDREGVVFTITQQPFFYQTRSFAAGMVALGVFLVVTLYRLRVRQVSRALSSRFDERLAERTRVAREIHDTFLQTVQASKMVADHALKDSADHARMVRAMEQLSAWLERASDEGRAALRSLRSSTTERNDLAEAFRRALDEGRAEGRTDLSFVVHGNAREVHPVVRDEIYRIGYEAICNARVHSGGTRLEVTLTYGDDLALRISDNGAGISTDILEKGKDGHYGLRGMRERAERIGAKLSVVSSPGSGTVITLVAPARIAFRSAHPREDRS